MIYVYTCILNGFDNVRQPDVQAQTFAKFICFTNVPNLPRVYPWEYRAAPVLDMREVAMKFGKWDGIEKRRFNGDRRGPVRNGRTERRSHQRRDSGWSRSSRLPKILPHLFLPDDCTESIYHDGNFCLKVDPSEVIKLLEEHDWAAHRHPFRNCIYDEANEVLKGCPLTNKEVVREQMKRYAGIPHPEHSGLWANGFIVRRHTPQVSKLNELWWKEFETGCDRDQISFPVARAKANVTLNTIDADIFGSTPYLNRRWHAPWREREDNPDYWAERARIQEKLDTLAALAGSRLAINYGMTRDEFGNLKEF